MENLVPWMDNDDQEAEFYDEEENDYEEFLNKRNRKYREDYSQQMDKIHKYNQKKQRNKKSSENDWLVY